MGDWISHHDVARRLGTTFQEADDWLAIHKIAKHENGRVKRAEFEAALASPIPPSPHSRAPSGALVGEVTLRAIAKRMGLDPSTTRGRERARKRLQQARLMASTTGRGMRPSLWEGQAVEALIARSPWLEGPGVRRKLPGVPKAPAKPDGPAPQSLPDLTPEMRALLDVMIREAIRCAVEKLISDALRLEFHPREDSA